jgi:hypothetical protein
MNTGKQGVRKGHLPCPAPTRRLALNVRQAELCEYQVEVDQLHLVVAFV